MHESTRRPMRRALLLSAAAMGAGLALPAQAQKRYDPGATDTEIRIGQTMPYSGPLSMLGTIGKATGRVLREGQCRRGINGRKLKLISLDDGYSPAKTVEGTRRLVEEDEVLLIFGTIGTADQPGDPPLPEHAQGAAAADPDGRQPLERPAQLPLHRQRHAVLPGRGAHVRAPHARPR